MEKELRLALEGIIWKLNHNWSAKDGKHTTKPATIDRNDACIRVAVLVLQGRTYKEALL